ncbi:MAG: glucuronate isomerase [Gammaproteobacteria bacterium]|nr:glucuronate isomerase [Gammaproteobacteria bacterium]
MFTTTINHPERLFPSDPTTRGIASDLYQTIRDLPIVSPHGHTDPSWFALNECFPDAFELLVKPDHYLVRMLYSQGIAMESLGIERLDQGQTDSRSRRNWQIFARNYHLYTGTPSQLWLNQVFDEVFGLNVPLGEKTADLYFDHINENLGRPEFRPRALFKRFNIEVLATTESPLDSLEHHQTIQQSDWNGGVITTYRPDPVVDPEFEGFSNNIEHFGNITDEDTSSYAGYLAAHRTRREFFRSMGATATDHGHPTAATADLDKSDCEKLYQKALKGSCNAAEAELFRAQMLTEMAKMSLEDNMVMQIHPGSFRNHNPLVFDKFGRDKGADIPQRTEYVNALKPLLDKVGNEPGLSIILFTLDETNYSRELAPLAGHYPCLRLGPPWWFHDSPEGMLRFREQVTETAGFYNTVGFNDDPRAFLSIPARHDVARRVDCAFLARWVAERRIGEKEAATTARQLAYELVKKAYRL